MAKKLIPMAIAYDFDGTLAPGNIPENSFIPAIGMKKSEFWQRNKERAEKHEADEISSVLNSFHAGAGCGERCACQA